MGEEVARVSVLIEVLEREGSGRQALPLLIPCGRYGRDVGFLLALVACFVLIL